MLDLSILESDNSLSREEMAHIFQSILKDEGLDEYIVNVEETCINITRGNGKDPLFAYIDFGGHVHQNLMNWFKSIAKQLK